MDDLCGRIERAALLHDIGKLVRRAHPEAKTHAASGSSAARDEIFCVLWDIITGVI